MSRNLTARLGTHLKIKVEGGEVVCRDEQGYYLRDWIVVRDAGGAVALGDVVAKQMVTSPASPAGAGVLVHAEPAAGVAHAADETRASEWNERQAWILSELRRGVRLQRVMIENRFSVGEKTAKRDLAELTRRGIVEFVRVGRDGYYRLAVADPGTRQAG